MGYLSNFCLKQPGPYPTSYGLPVTSGWFSMKVESNRGINSRMQIMVRNYFPLLSLPSQLPLVSQGNKHHKEPKFLYLLLTISFLHHFVYTYVTLFQKFII